MSSNRSAFFTDSRTILSQIKSQLEEINGDIAKRDVNAVLARMERVIKTLDLLADKQKREAVDVIKNKFKDLQNQLPDFAEIYIKHVLFLQQIDEYAESYDHLEKMNLHEITHQSLIISVEQRVCTYDLLAKLYLRNGAITGAKMAATKALSHNPNYAPAMMVIGICNRAESYNETCAPDKRTCVKDYTFAYLTPKDVEIFTYLGIKQDDITSHLQKRSHDSLVKSSIANSTIGFLAEMRKKLAQSVGHAKTSQEPLNTPTLKRT